MFYHVKDLQFNAKVSRPDPRFASLLLEQFGGANGELAAALRYFGQSFAAKNPYPDKYDLLMDIATEEFSHLEIVGATIQMLLTGVNGALKNAADNAEIMQLLKGTGAKEEMIHQGIDREFLVASAGAPAFINAEGAAWTASYINGDVQGDLTSDLRSDVAAETRAKIVYEYLLQFTDDPSVKETLRFLMTREIAHFQMFQAALESIEPNFPPGILQGDPRYSNLYFNFSNGNDFRGAWNEGKSTEMGETYQYIDDPIKHVLETNGLRDQEVAGSNRTEKSVQKLNKDIGEIRSTQVNSTSPAKDMSWNRPLTQEEIDNICGKPETKSAKSNGSKKKNAQK
jgi:Mn-containing catalase